MNNEQFQKLLKDGKKGEALVYEYLTSLNYNVYVQDSTNAEYFDFLITTPKYQSEFKKALVEVKTTKEMDKYAANGFSLYDLKSYKDMQTQFNCDMFIIFVDKKLKRIYGNKLNILLEHHTDKYGVQYPKIVKSRVFADGKWTGQYNDTIIFSLDKMDVYKSKINI